MRLTQRMSVEGLFIRHDPMWVVRRYIDCINERDISGVGAVLGEDCRLIDARGDWIEGHDTCLEAIERFFEIEPKYHLQIGTMGRGGEDVLITGQVTAMDPRFATSTLFRARADHGHLYEWQSYSPVLGPGMCRLLAGEKTHPGPFLESAY